jgi:hypothetical protein
MAPRYGDIGTAPRYGDIGTEPRYGDIGTAPRYGDIGTEPRYCDIGTAPRYGDIGTAPRYGAAMRLLRRLGQRPTAGGREPPPRPSLIGSPATPVSGLRPDGTPIRVETGAGTTVILFLTSTCYGCRPLWPQAGAAPSPMVTGGVVVVTPDPETESAIAVAAMAAVGTQVVMSSPVWHAYRVTRAPWCVVVEDGLVTQDGLAPESWAELNGRLTGGPGAGPGRVAR